VKDCIIGVKVQVLLYMYAYTDLSSNTMPKYISTGRRTNRTHHHKSSNLHHQKEILEEFRIKRQQRGKERGLAL